MRIWIDADACPRPMKELVFKAAHRLEIPTTLVANSGMFVPRGRLISLQVVDGGIDAADRHIVEHAAAGDLAVTADLPLAAALVEREVIVIDPRGRVYDARNVGEALATRNLMTELREGGVMEGGPAPIGPKERERFANALDRELTRLRREADRRNPTS